jgi:hypothetical protein
MTELILSIISTISLLALGIYAIRKQRTAANVALCLSALLLAGIELFDQWSLRSAVDFATFKQISLYLESLLPGSLLLLAFTYGRSKPSKIRLGLMAALILLCSLFPEGKGPFPWECGIFVLYRHHDFTRRFPREH